MLVLLLLGGTAIGVVLLVLYSRYLFEENRTRVSRVSEAPATAAEAPSDELLWRTVVDPVEAANRARASKPFALAYARAMTSQYDDRAA